MRRRRVFEFFTGRGPAFGFGLEPANPHDFDPNLSGVFDRRVDTFNERIRNHACLIYRPNGKSVASYFWTSEPGAIVPLTPWINFVVPEGFTYIWDCKTDERVRNRGYYTNGLREIMSERDCLISVEGNPSARAAVVKAGFAPIATIDTRNIGPVNIINGAVKFTGARISLSPPPATRLS